MVSGDDGVGLAGRGGFEDSVVWVVCHDGQLLGGICGVGNGADQCDDAVGLGEDMSELRVSAELGRVRPTVPGW